MERRTADARSLYGDRSRAGSNRVSKLSGLHTPRRAVRRAAIAASLALWGGCSEPPSGPAPTPPTVSVVTPLTRSVVESRRYTGRLEPVERVEVRARVRGYLARMLFREGAEVAKGTPLYEIDPRTFRAGFDQVRAECDKLEAEVGLAEREAERSAWLVARSATSEQEHQIRLATRSMAAAALDRCRSELEAAALELEFTKITAAIDGRVGRTLVTEGNLVGQDGPTLLTTLVRMDRLHLTFEIPEADLLTHGASLGVPDAVSSGSPGRVVRFGLDTDEGAPHEAVVDFRDTAVDPNTGTVLIRAVVENRERKFSPGMFARVELPVPWPEPRPHVPESALGTDQQGRFVYVVDAEGKARRKGVTAGPVDGSLVAIEEGLGPEDRVIVDGQVRVRAGSPVNVEGAAVERAVGAGEGAR
ncbi:efflux RND transporter periplasmic adaptor subunit [soil metagenome]